MKTSFSLLQLSREELLTLADSRILVSLASRVESEALPRLRAMNAEETQCIPDFEDLFSATVKML